MKAILALIALSALIVGFLMLIGMAIAALLTDSEENWEKLYMDEWERHQ